jgi:hypothetical protein
MLPSYSKLFTFEKTNDIIYKLVVATVQYI